ncbi:hypothetical protein [Streptomyces niveus]|uniref:hypothetical protein n=1 Tax=Streptomyces niveus TaxID=193462 RepID=UPI0034480270
MANRTRQADRLAYDLSEQTDVRVEVSYLGGAEWEVRWPGGPTLARMRELVGHSLSTDTVYPGLRDRKLVYTRGESDRAWAARAVAAHREGTLAPAVAERAPLHGHSRTPMTRDWSPEDYAVLAIVEEIVQNTPFPDRASHPDDEELIEQLLKVANGQRREMGRLLLSGNLHGHAATPPDPSGPPSLRIVRDTDDRPGGAA